jgi:hypothetical protein
MRHSRRSRSRYFQHEISSLCASESIADSPPDDLRGTQQHRPGIVAAKKKADTAQHLWCCATPACSGTRLLGTVGLLCVQPTDDIRNPYDGDDVWSLSGDILHAIRT